jgi:flagellin-like hook-associated protein FlgL
MASGITLSAGVRQNLLSLQNTADLMATTQSRLATGKKVNSALDNPSNFFTSQSLSDRASDLNSLLDSIGQATKVLEAADKGLTSLTKLVQSAKSAAQQARQATGAVSTYAAVNANSDISAAANLNGDEVIGTLTGNNTTLTAANFDPIAIAKTYTIDAETLATHDGAAVTVADSTLYSFDIAINGGAARTVDFTSGVGANYAGILAGLQADLATELTAAGYSGRVTLSTGGGGDDLKIDAVDSDIDIVISNRTANTGLTNNTYNSTSMLDNIVAAGGVAGTSKLSISVNGAADQDIVFGTGGGQVSTIADLNTALQALTGGVSASAVAGANGLSFSLAAGATNSLRLTASDVGVRNGIGLDSARTAGQGGGLGVGVTDLSRTYNSAATLADADPTNLLSGGNLTITVNGSAQTVGLAATDRLSDMITKLQANATLNNNLTFETSSGDLKITAKTADVDFVVTHNNTSAAIGLTAGANVTTNSTSLLDRLNTKMGGTNGQGATVTLAVNGGSTQTITFGTADGQISTKAELSTALGNLSGLTASLSGTSLNFQVASGTSATSLTIGGTAASALGLTAGTTSGAVTSTTANSTRSSLQNDFNNVLDQIDALSKDASYNGINLLNGDNLKVLFNENGSSSLTISGVTFQANNLGLNKVSGDYFQDNTKIDTTISAIDSALTTLRTQASKFGSNLTTVQTRQDFTKNMVNTLQTGSDALVLADTNEEGANMLALQTRQQLSTTALSLANQANQAVLRMF